MGHPKERAALELGYDVPAEIGMREADVQTPCLVLDLDALERNVAKMGRLAREMGVRHRSHGKMHRSVDVQRLQQDLGGACGVCCQKVSEAEAFVRGGITDVLISNQVRDPLKIDRMARLPMLGARIIVCIDDIDNVAEISEAARRHGTEIECLIEIDCGAARCGVSTPKEAVAIASALVAAPSVSFSGVQAYHGSAQHLPLHADREAAIASAVDLVRGIVTALAAAGHECRIVGGGGTGSFAFEAASGLYDELQCGSYAFMDVSYGEILDREGRRLDADEWENALFVLTSVMSHAKPGAAVCDAGLKAMSLDSGLPAVFGRDDVVYTKCSDEHGVIEDPQGVLRVNERLRLVPGHCDPTCNLHDWYVGVRGGVVEALWPVTARGRGY